MNPRVLVVTERSNVVLVRNEVRKRWVKDHRCILALACPQCRAPRGSPCVGPHGPRGATHYRRRDAARKEVHR